MVDDPGHAPPRHSHLHLREALPGDAEAMAEVWIASWREAYRDLLSPATLRALDRSRQMAHWLTTLLGRELAPDAGRAFVAVATIERGGGGVVGLCETGPVRGNAGIGEIFTLYVAPWFHRRGAGSALLEHACADLAQRGFEHVILWVLQGNGRARAFYERHGLRFDGRRRVEPMAGRPVSLRYGRSLTR